MRQGSPSAPARMTKRRRPGGWSAPNNPTGAPAEAVTPPAAMAAGGMVGPEHLDGARGRGDDRPVGEGEPEAAIHREEAVAGGPVGRLVRAPIGVDPSDDIARQAVGEACHGVSRWDGWIARPS